MKLIKHWDGARDIEVAESAGGVLATVNPLANLVQAGVEPWPVPELVQKLYASEKWRGKTEADDQSARHCLGYYCDLQSLNSEDAITWGVLGPLIYGPAEWRHEFAGRVFKILGFPNADSGRSRSAFLSDSDHDSWLIPISVPD